MVTSVGCQREMILRDMQVPCGPMVLLLHSHPCLTVYLRRNGLSPQSPMVIHGHLSLPASRFTATREQLLVTEASDHHLALGH